MVLKKHKQFHDDIFSIFGFYNSPFLMFGFQAIDRDFDEVVYRSFKHYLLDHDVEDITVLDYEDPRADVHFDMNYPWNQDTNEFINKFEVVCDIGCLEHVFNTAQVMANCISAVKIGGIYILHTPIMGYHLHGFHTFNPNMLKWVFKNNGFKIEYDVYSTKQGERISKPEGDSLLWLVGRKIENVFKFVYPIQDRQKIFESRITSKGYV